jgi:hypothetical protein
LSEARASTLRAGQWQAHLSQRPAPSIVAHISHAQGRDVQLPVGRIWRFKDFDNHSADYGRMGDGNGLASGGGACLKEVLGTDAKCGAAFPAVAAKIWICNPSLQQHRLGGSNLGNRLPGPFSKIRIRQYFVYPADQAKTLRGLAGGAHRADAHACIPPQARRRQAVKRTGLQCLV